MIPSVQSSAEAIALARRALDDHGRFWLGNPGKVEKEFYELAILADEDRYVTVDIALHEIRPQDRLGPRPPANVSSHPPFPGKQLYAFCWRSVHLKKQMYMKFALLGGSGSCKLALYSFHEEKPENERIDQ